MSIAETISGLSAQEFQGQPSLAPSPEELFPDLTQVNPDLVRVYQALLTTSPARQRDPAILTDLVFGDRVSSGDISRKGARLSFEGLSKKLTKLLEERGVRIVKKKGYGKGSLMYLDQTPLDEIQRIIETDYFTGIEFGDPSVFPPDPSEINTALSKAFHPDSRAFSDASLLLEDFMNRKPTHDVAFGRTLAHNPELENYEAMNIAQEAKKRINSGLHDKGIAVTSVRSPKYSNSSNNHLTFVKVGEDGKIPTGKFDPEKATHRIIPDNTPKKKAERHPTHNEAVPILPITEATVDMAEFPENVAFADRDDMQRIQDIFRSGTRREKLLQTLIHDLQAGSLTYIPRLLEKAFGDLPDDKKTLNLAAALTPLNGILRDFGIAIASLHAPAPRDIPHTFYTLIKAGLPEGIIKGKIVARTTPEEIIDTPQATEQAPETDSAHLPSNLEEKPATIKPNILRPGEDGFNEKLSFLKEAIAQTEIPEPELFDQRDDKPEDEHPVLPTELENNPLSVTQTSETDLAEGNEADLTPGYFKNGKSQENIEKTDDPYPNLTSSARTVITALFGNGTPSPVGLAVVAEAMRPGRKIRADHILSASLSLGNVMIGDNSDVRIVKKSDGRLDVQRFQLEYPEGWTLYQILQYLNGQTPNAQSLAHKALTQLPITPNEQRPGKRGYIPNPILPPAEPSQKPAHKDPDHNKSVAEVEFASLFNGKNHSEWNPNTPTLKLDLGKMEWHINGKGGKIPFRELIPLLARLASSPQGVDRFALAGLRSGDQNQKIIESAARNFLNLQKMFDNPEDPKIFIATGGGRYSTFRMLANIELI